MELLQSRKLLTTKKITIWENTDGRADKYTCANKLYLLSMLSHAYKIVIDHGVISPGNGKYVVYGLNATYKSFLHNIEDSCETYWYRH